MALPKKTPDSRGESGGDGRQQLRLRAQHRCRSSHDDCSRSGEGLGSRCSTDKERHVSGVHTTNAVASDASYPREGTMRAIHRGSHPSRGRQDGDSTSCEAANESASPNGKRPTSSHKPPHPGLGSSGGPPRLGPACPRPHRSGACAVAENAPCTGYAR